jgi:hypothetical protein
MRDELVGLARFEEGQQLADRLLHGLQMLYDCCTVHYRVITRSPPPDEKSQTFAEG